MPIPELERHCGSWIAVGSDGRAFRETFDRATAETLRRMGFEIVTAAQWLARYNAAVRMAGGVEPSTAQLRNAACPVPAIAATQQH